MAHALEDCFAAAQQGHLQLRQNETDLLLRGVDLLLHIAQHSEATTAGWEVEHGEQIPQFLDAMRNLLSTSEPPSPTITPPTAVAEVVLPGTTSPPQLTALAAADRTPPPERVVRLSTENLNRLLGLAGESLVESRWLRPCSSPCSGCSRRCGRRTVAMAWLRSATRAPAGLFRARSRM